MVKIYQVYQEQRVVYCGYTPRTTKWENVLVGQFADKSAADKKCNELNEISKPDYGNCFVRELSIPKEVVEQALKNVTSQQA